MQLSEDILFWAFRYALGRKTYASNNVADEVLAEFGLQVGRPLLPMLAHASEIHPATRDKMAKEIREAIASDTMNMVGGEWYRVLGRLNELDAFDEMEH